jgi:hypothetical protein
MRSFILCSLLGALIATSGDARPLPGHKNPSKADYSVTSVKSPVRAGKKAQRFEVRAGDCDGQDCTSGSEGARYYIDKYWKYGTEQWVGFSVFLPGDFQTSNRAAAHIGMLHHRGAPTNTEAGERRSPPVAQFSLRGSKLLLTVHYLSGNTTEVRDEVQEFPLASLADMRGRWTDIVFRFDTSNRQQLLEVYVNGKRRTNIPDLLELGADRANIPVYQREAVIENFIRFRPKDYHFYYGIIRPFPSQHGGAMPTQIIYIDEVRMGRDITDVLVNEKAPVD